ncbi:unnamed protein product [Angiostrongylus costaricensis]|uniref:Uncharacterized protein n=1 Tax=Angiostrongylus costaricensis TaxID=334426 RepID=A0A0R3PR66_ANGCS|nr:unnamed protein product [Angiostrongylus costaricensis]
MGVSTSSGRRSASANRCQAGEAHERHLAPTQRARLENGARFRKFEPPSVCPRGRQSVRVGDTPSVLAGGRPPAPAVVVVTLTAGGAVTAGGRRREPGRLRAAFLSSSYRVFGDSISKIYWYTLL